MQNYKDLLDRAFQNMPSGETKTERFVIPQAKISIEGKTTVLENFKEIADVLNREKAHLLKYLSRELGTAGRSDDDRAIFQGKFFSEQINDLIKEYSDEFVICSECGRPDTRLVRVGRVMTLQCDACGGHRPLSKIKAKKKSESVLEEGKTYDFTVEKMGKKNDGIANFAGYTIFIPHTKKGERVRVTVKKIAGKLAFTELVEKL